MMEYLPESIFRTKCYQTVNVGMSVPDDTVQRTVQDSSETKSVDGQGNCFKRQY